jgi:hypothetical protein
MLLTLQAIADEVIEWRRILLRRLSRFWHKADMAACLLYVRFRGQSGHGLSEP